MQNRVVIITGASSGIGAAAAKHLARSSRLLLVARRQDRIAALAEEIQADGGTAAVCAADLTKPDSVKTVIDAAMESFGAIDALVNNAGIFETAEIGEYSQQHLDSLMTLNFNAPVLLTQAALPHLIANGGGWVINVSSVAATQIFGGCGIYGATKAALDQWSAVIREELRPKAFVSALYPRRDPHRNMGLRSSLRRQNGPPRKTSPTPSNSASTNPPPHPVNKP